MKDFRLPDVGEGLTEAEVVAWHVTVGDVVSVNDTLVEVETAKSIVELPSPYAGVVHAVHVDAGVAIPVGTIMITIRDENATASPDDGKTASPGVEQTPEVLVEIEEKPSVLVGTGPSAPAARRRRLRSRDSRSVTDSVDGPRAFIPAKPASLPRARATPPVRLLAKQLEVNLELLVAQTDGVITRSEVELAAKTSIARNASAAPRETRIPIKGVRKAIATAMTGSAFTAPHVTEWLTVDVTATMDMVTRLRNDLRWGDVRVTPLTFVAKAFLMAIKKYPAINAQWDEANQEIILKHFVNLGIAAATPRGLIVPNIKEAHTMSAIELAGALQQLVVTARSGKTTPEEMSQGTITITNIGALGVDTGTPILNTGEAAILAFGSVREIPWVVDGAILPRQVTQLAMSFDHRLVDGELGSNVLMDVGRLLNDPAEAMLRV